MMPSPPICAVISRMRSRGNGGSQRGFMAMDISFIGLSSAAMRLESILPHRRQRWTMAHSPPLRTQTATGSINPPQADALSPGPSSTCRLQRQFGQWLQWVLPAPSGTTTRPQFLQVNTSLQACVLYYPFSKHCRAGRPALAYSMAKNICQERSAKSQPVCILCRTGCRPVKLCILKFYLISRAIPHNSKCRYGERGTADAKPKAQIILCVLSSILATQLPCRSRRSGA